VHRSGPISFADFLEIVLYDDAGFYGAGGGAGRGADFITSPEVGPLFGAVVASALDGWWDDLGRPDPFLVVEAGAGTGSLALSVLDAGPRCGPALRYVMVERSARLRAVQADRLPVEVPAAVLGPVVARKGDDDEEPRPLSGTGPLVTSLAELPAGSFTGVVLANELLDNLPFDLLERGDGDWSEVRVGDEAGRLVEALVPAPPDLALLADRLAPDAPTGARIPVQAAAQRWLRTALGALDRGRVVVVDYAATTPELARRPWPAWLRTYRGHGRGGHPLDDPGDQDVTCEVAVDQLARVAPPHLDDDQAAFLRAHGLDALVETAAAAWEAGAARGDLAALRARSRVTEGRALTDPDGLGAFRVLQWAVA
jgi:SAM-dependent MidA family methyltransferase